MQTTSLDSDSRHGMLIVRSRTLSVEVSLFSAPNSGSTKLGGGESSRKGRKALEHGGFYICAGSERCLGNVDDEPLIARSAQVLVFGAHATRAPLCSAFESS